MSTLDPSWKTEDFISTQHKHQNPLMKNNLTLTRDAGFEFTTYRVNESFPCYPYEQVVRLCHNKHGVLTADLRMDKNCMTATKWFNECLDHQKYMALEKKYEPINFKSTEVGRSNYTINDLF